MRTLFQTRLNNHLKVRMKQLISILSNSGVFLLVPFLMLTIYALVHIFNQEQLNSFQESFIIASVFLFLFCNHRIRSLLTDQDEVYLAPKVNGMGRYFRGIIYYNLLIQFIKCGGFLVLIVFLLDSSPLLFIVLVFSLTLSAVLHVMVTMIFISLDLKRRGLYTILQYLYIWLMIVFLFVEMNVFIFMISLALFSTGYWLTKNKLFPIHSWKRLSLSDQRSDAFFTLFMSNFTNVSISLRPARGRKLLILFLTVGKDEALPYLLARSLVRGTESGRLFMRVLLLTAALILFVNNLIALVLISVVLVALNTRQFTQGFPPYGQLIPPHYPVEQDQYSAAIHALQKRALLLQTAFFSCLLLIKWISMNSL